MFPVRNPLSLPGEVVLDVIEEPYSYDHCLSHVVNIPFEINSTGFSAFVPMFPLGANFGESVHLLIKRIEIRYAISVKDPNGVAQRVRVIVAYDRQGPTDDLLSIDPLLAPPVTVLSPFRTDTSKRFLSLMDRVHDLSAHGVPGATRSYTFVRYVRLPLQLQTGVDAGYPVYGALRFAVITTEPTGDTSSMMTWSYSVCFDYNKSPSEI